MGYELGIDLGTTYTAAAVFKDGDTRIFPLGGRSASMPSVVHLREDETVLTGEAAVRRAITEPDRIAREFKRRLGDSAPIIVGGTPYSAEALMARVLKHALAEVTKREGEPPQRVAVCHPANWGEYKRDLLRQAVRIAGLDPDETVLLTEPEAAAIYYSSEQRVDPGEIVAVYDLGGGTFDTAVLQRTSEGFQILGRPEGIERLGGIDFDAAVFAHVARSIGSALDDLDPDDPMAVSAVARLRQDCVEAKEALSSDTDAAIPVMLPNFQTEVRITRSEFEAIIRPSLSDSLDAMKRALDSAGVKPDDVKTVLLVGGSSRIPLISQMVSSGLGRPVAVDTHPKHAVAMGAALAASDELAVGALVAPTSGAPTVTNPPSAPVVAEAQPVVDPVVAEPAEMTPPAVAEPEVGSVSYAAPTVDSVVEAPHLTPKPAAPDHRAPERPGPAPATAPPVAPTPAPGYPPERSESEPSSDGSKVPVFAGIGAAVLVLGLLGFFGLRALGDEGTTEVAGETTEAPAVTEPPDAEPAATVPAETTLPPPEVSLAEVNALVGDLDPIQNEIEVAVEGNEVTLSGQVANGPTRALLIDAIGALEAAPTVSDNLEVVPVDEQCTELIRSQPHWACLESATLDADNVVTANYISDFGDDPFSTGSGFHLHVFSGDIDPATAGAAGDASIDGAPWLVWDTPEVISANGGGIYNGDAPEKICLRIATPNHTLESLDSGQCTALVQE